jgi:hypothetical protein
VGVVIHATRLMQPGEFALWGNGKLIASGLLGSRLEPTAFDAVALHVDDSAVLCLRLGDGSRDPGSVLGAIAGWWEYEVPSNKIGPTDREQSRNQGDQPC